SKNRAFVFIDEIQRKENAGLFLKGLYDMKGNFKFIVSGSGSLELKEKIAESLMGRKRVIELRPVSFFEFVNYKTKNKYQNKIADFLNIEKEKCRILLEEYLNFGGYPKVITAETREEKQIHINEIYNSYLDRDIKGLLSLEKPESFTKLIRLLAADMGQTINYSKLGTDTGLAAETLKKYLYYAEKTFCIQHVSAYFTNKIKESNKASKIYFNDIGLRNYAIDEFGLLTREQEFAFPFENLILDILKERIKNSSSQIHFWRTTDKAEVDFVIDTGKELIPVEVKFSSYKQAHLPPSLKNFINKYNCKQAYLVNLSLNETIHYEACHVRFLTLGSLSNITFHSSRETG
ncbi:MAG: ATP-binding protein, partial [Candidatus Caenarcaniphilales bacterium]|nr:ATP-binding protein [Candidatus Caenarcaniphilales bacterium]